MKKSKKKTTRKKTVRKAAKKSVRKKAGSRPKPKTEPIKPPDIAEPPQRHRDKQLDSFWEPCAVPARQEDHRYTTEKGVVLRFWPAEPEVVLSITNGQQTNTVRSVGLFSWGAFPMPWPAGRFEERWLRSAMWAVRARFGV